jgi:hypothetical protein
VFFNHLSAFSEDLENKIVASNKKGVVGKTGNITPMIPNETEKKPRDKNKIFIYLFTSLFSPVIAFNGLISCVISNVPK